MLSHFPPLIRSKAAREYVQRQPAGWGCDLIEMTLAATHCWHTRAFYLCAILNM